MLHHKPLPPLRSDALMIGLSVFKLNISIGFSLCFRLSLLNNNIKEIIIVLLKGDGIIMDGGQICLIMIS